jgi:hypothetical protein
MDDSAVETCHLCNLKVRIKADKAAVARCPKCKGPLGDPKIDQGCPGCKAVNRVLRSRLAAARCGKCKEALLGAGPLPRELVLAETYGLIGAVYADPLLSRRVSRPNDLVEAMAWAEELPRSIAELAANITLGEDRDRLTSLSVRCKALPAKLRPEIFVDPSLLVDQGHLESAMLLEAFEVIRHDPAGFRLLKQIRSGETGASAARIELGAAAAVFERLLNRLHKTDWNDLQADQARRSEVAEGLFKELIRVVESWLPRPYKLEALTKSCLMRLEEQPWSAQAVEATPELVREDVRAFQAIVTAIITRGVTVHELGNTPSAVWPALVTPLRIAALAAVS